MGGQIRTIGLKPVGRTGKAFGNYLGKMNMKVYSLVRKSTGVGLLCGWIFLQTMSLADEKSAEANRVEALTPDYVHDLVVDNQGRALQISGQVDDNVQLSQYINLLNEQIGFASLESLRRDGSTSRFVLLIKLFAPR